MPSIKSVDDIKSSLLRPSLTSQFYVEIPVPNLDSQFKQKLQENGVSWPTKDQDTINLLCSEAVLPGSSLATFEINNDRTGVTERHVHRRMFDDRIDLTFYVDAENYLPIKFFETWIDFIGGGATESDNKLINKNYFYRMNYPDDYTADQGLKVIKFERDTYKSSSQGGYNRPTGSVLEYNFVRAFPLSITSMPVSYDASSLLKCTVSMSYIRYVVTMKKASESLPASTNPTKVSDLKNKSLSQNFLKNGAFNLPSSNVA
tara:strand:+ start:61 stop:840 length:780 start_codon:yes stop_codon:yes gene_type:complete